MLESSGNIGVPTSALGIPCVQSRFLEEGRDGIPKRSARGSANSTPDNGSFLLLPRGSFPTAMSSVLHRLYKLPSYISDKGYFKRDHCAIRFAISNCNQRVAQTRERKDEQIKSKCVAYCKFPGDTASQLN